MTRTNEIATLLKINEEQVELVRDQMDYSGIDYSECTQAEFDACARKCFAAIQPKPLQVTIDDDVEAMELAANLILNLYVDTHEVPDDKDYSELDQNSHQRKNL